VQLSSTYKFHFEQLHKARFYAPTYFGYLLYLLYLFKYFICVFIVPIFIYALYFNCAYCTYFNNFYLNVPILILYCILILI